MSPDLNSKSNKAEEPEAYRVGHVPFLGATIYLDTRPLIPRTETEWWVEKFIDDVRAKGTGNTIRVLDLFSGSGCIGVAVLKNLPTATVTFGEFDARHLATIERNVRENAIDENRVHIVQTDVWSAIPGDFDAVLANPPYLSEARLSRIEPSVLEHEPVGALFADDDGFALIDATILGLPLHLAQGGQSWIEHEPEHEDRIRDAALRVGLLATTYKDQYGIVRYSVILKP